MIRDRLPSLDAAFNPAAMTSRLQAALWGSKQAGFSIEKCSPGKAILLPDGICAMQHALEIRDHQQGNTFRTLVNSRLYPDSKDAETYFQDRLLPLLNRVDQHPVLTPFPAPAGVLEDMALVYAVFPVDGEIPTLLDATQLKRLLPIFRETLPESRLGFQVDGFLLEPAHYGRYQRCVLRYRLTSQPSGDGEIQEHLIYGKVDMSGQERLTVPVTHALQDYFRSGRLANPFRVPYALAYLPNLKLLLMDTLQGSPIIKQLLRDRLKGTSSTQADGLTLEDSIRDCAQIVSTLHQSGVGVGARRSVWKELDGLDSEIRLVLDWLPDLTGALRDAQAVVESLAASSEPLPMVFNHGDFRYTQLIFLGKEAGLVDFGTVCQAEPALDLGQFLAYQRMTIRKEQNAHPEMPYDGTDELCELFLTSYIQSNPNWTGEESRLRARVALYEILNILRLATHSWQKLKPARAQAAMEVLKERIVCLSSVR